MIPTGSFIWNVAGATGAGIYTLDLYLSAIPDQVRVGDVLTCYSTGYRYSVVTWTDYPSVLFSDGANMTVQFIDSDEPPTQDVDYFSNTESLIIPDYMPEVAWGCIISSSVQSVPAYTYDVTLSDKFVGELHPGSGQRGDYILDHLGRTYEILTWTSWDSTFKVYDINETAVAPYSGGENRAVVYKPKVGAPITHQGVLTLLDQQRAPDWARNLDTVVDWIHRGLRIKDSPTAIVDTATGISQSNVTELIGATGIQLGYEQVTGWQGGKRMTIGVAPGVGYITAGEADGSPEDSGINRMLLGTNSAHVVFNDPDSNTSYWFVDAAPSNLSGSNLAMSGSSFYNSRESADTGAATFHETAPGTQNDYTSMDGTMVLTTSSTTFGNADIGNVEVVLNGTTIADGDLAANFQEGSREGDQTISGYDTQGTGDPMTNGVVNFTGGAAGKGNMTILSVGWTSDIGASAYQKGQVQINITDGSLWRKGYNTVVVSHNGSSTSSFKFFHDEDTGTPTAINVDLDPDSPSYKYLSGVKYYGSGSTFDSKSDIQGGFDNVYHISNAPVLVGGFPGISPAAIAYDHISAFGVTGIPYIGADMGVTGYHLPLGTDQETNDAKIYYAPRDPYGDYTGINSPSHNITIMSYLNEATNKMEYFRDEQYRFPTTTNFNAVPGSVTGNWTSSSALSPTGLQVYNEDATSNTNELYWPQHDYSTSRDPVGPDYYTYTAGQGKEYVRVFVASFDASNGIVRVPGITNADIDSDNVKILIKVPTKTMWLSLNDDYDMGTFTTNANYSGGVDETGCRIDKTSYGPDLNSKLRFTLGSYAADTGVSRCLFLRVIYKDNTIPRYLHGSGGFGVTDW